MKVFISHSDNDIDYAKHLGDLLTKSGFVVFQESGGLSGANFPRYLRKSLDESSAMIVLFSKNTLETPWAAFELGVALSKGKLIIPVIKGNPSIPPALGKFKVIDGSREDEVVVRDIVEAIQK